MKRMLKAVAEFALRRLTVAQRRRLLDFVAGRQSPEQRLRAGMPDMWASIENVKRNGFTPATIIDGGAYVGEWAKRVRTLFPASAVLMLEANPEKQDTLESVARTIGNATVRIALLGPEDRERVPFHVMETGSSVLAELTSAPRSTTALRMTTVDGIVAEARARGPFFLKLDVQGFELEVLKGARATLRDTEVVLLEVALLQYNSGAPLFAEVVAFMKEAGFVAYDVCGQLRRQSDDAIFQVDLMFVREASALRAPKPFWN